MPPVSKSIHRDLQPLHSDRVQEARQDSNAAQNAADEVANPGHVFNVESIVAK